MIYRNIFFLLLLYSWAVRLDKAYQLEMREWFSDLFRVVTEGGREEWGYWVEEAGGFKGRARKWDAERWDDLHYNIESRLSKQDIVVGWKKLSDGWSNIRSWETEKTDDSVNVITSYGLRSNRTQILETIFTKHFWTTFARIFWIIFT